MVLATIVPILFSFCSIPLSSLSALPVGVHTFSLSCHLPTHRLFVPCSSKALGVTWGFLSLCLPDEPCYSLLSP